MARKLKIGIVFDDNLDRSDGVQQYVKYIGRWLQSSGQTVHFLVGESKASLNPDLTIHSLSKNINVRGNKNILSIPLPASKKRIRRLLTAERYDVLHVQVPYNPLLAGRIITAAPPSTAIIGTFHIVGASWLENCGSWLLGKLQRRTLKRFDKMLSVSTAAKSYAQKYFNLESEILPNVVDVNKFAAGRSRDDINHGLQTVIFINRLVERKGLRYLIEAFSILKQQDKLNNRQLIICGKGPQRQQMQELVTRYQLEDYVTFAGFIAETNKPDYLASADLAVFPSIGGESFGIVLIEAMASGTLTLGGNNVGYASVLRDWPQTLFDPKDTRLLADLIDSFLINKDAAAAISKQQLTTVRQYSLETVGPKLLGYYDKALSGLDSKRRNRHTIVEDT